MASTDQKTQSSAGLHEENLRLRRAVDELSTLNDLARTIGVLTNSHEIMEIIIRRSIRATHAEQGVITLLDNEPKAGLKTLVRTMVSSVQHGQYHFNESLLGWMHLNAKPLLINDPEHDERFRGVKWDPSIRSLLCVPLMVKSVLKGVLTVYNKRDASVFSEEDQRLLAIVAAQSAQVIENARLYESEQALNRMKQELSLAAQIQRDLLPRVPPTVRGYDVAGKTIPAQTVGGDYFDFLAIDDRQVAFCVGDVSGKGLPASLLMANVQATLRGQAMLGDRAKVCVARSNKLLHSSTSSDKFVTLVYGILDVERHALCYCNAGHEAPLHVTDAGVSQLSSGGVVLGILPDFPFEEDTITLAPGDTVVIFSDGINEAVNQDRQQYGYDRLTEVILAAKDLSAAEIINRIESSVSNHVGSEPQSDDMTILVIKRLSA